MAKRRDHRPARRPDHRPDEAPSFNPFAGLGSLRDELPAGDPSPPSEAPAASSKPPRGPARAVVRYQRKGRGGKEATLVEQLGLPAETLDQWCQEFKRALGCGGTIENERMVFAGDQRARLPGMLEAKGVRRVTTS